MVKSSLKKRVNEIFEETESYTLHDVEEAISEHKKILKKTRQQKKNFYKLNQILINLKPENTDRVYSYYKKSKLEDTAEIPELIELWVDLCNERLAKKVAASINKILKAPTEIFYSEQADLIILFENKVSVRVNWAAMFFSEKQKASLNIDPIWKVRRWIEGPENEGEEIFGYSNKFDKTIIDAIRKSQISVAN